MRIIHIMASMFLFVISLIVFAYGAHYVNTANNSIHQIYGMLHFVSGDILLLGAVIGFYLLSISKEDN